MALQGEFSRRADNPSDAVFDGSLFGAKQLLAWCFSVVSCVNSRSAEIRRTPA